MITVIFLLCLGISLLVFGGNIFVDSAHSLAKRFRMPEVLIGATVVSIGTTLPEVTVSASASISGAGDVAYGNAIGSIICNTALICAISLLVRPSRCHRREILLPSVFFAVAGVVYIAVSYTTSYFSRGFGIAILSLFFAFILLSVILGTERTKDFDAY